MKNTISELWNGNLDPVRYYGVDNHRTKLLEIMMARNAEKLEKELGEQAFCDGFCLGSKIVAEALVAPLPME